ncbi:hypothetical protein [Paracoccus actinidiae]|uniref:hypothetical protein n=1 Tax=Paracoccus actinidiae TaxID=3064531 RepID=UPI0027D2DEFD|nr:hypothetical protein [Paracoccus sp. M09]
MIMTSRDRASLSVELSERLAVFFDRAGGSLEAGDLVRQFCNSEGAKLADAEIALSLLLNQHRLVVAEDMKLESALAHAA